VQTLLTINLFLQRRHLLMQNTINILSHPELCAAYSQATHSLNHYLDTVSSYDQLKLATSYFNWISKKTDLVKNENTFKIPYFALPNTFTKAQYDWLKPEKQIVFSKYYKFDSSTNKYIINIAKSAIPYEDIDMLMHSLVLTRKSVLWVEFGVNIGSEFGGRHPAIILKNLDDSLIVVPLSSQCPESDKFTVKIDSVYGFPTLQRWANVTHICEIDIARVDFTCRIGNVNSKVMSDIANKMHSCGIL